MIFDTIYFLLKSYCLLIYSLRSFKLLKLVHFERKYKSENGLIELDHAFFRRTILTQTDPQPITEDQLKLERYKYVLFKASNYKLYSQLFFSISFIQFFCAVEFAIFGHHNYLLIFKLIIISYILVLDVEGIRSMYKLLIKHVFDRFKLSEQFEKAETTFSKLFFKKIESDITLTEEELDQFTVMKSKRRSKNNTLRIQGKIKQTSRVIKSLKFF